MVRDPARGPLHPDVGPVGEMRAPDGAWTTPGANVHMRARRYPGARAIGAPRALRQVMWRTVPSAGSARLSRTRRHLNPVTPEGAVTLLDHRPAVRLYSTCLTRPATIRRAINASRSRSRGCPVRTFVCERACAPRSRTAENALASPQQRPSPSRGTSLPPLGNVASYVTTLSRHCVLMTPE